jgi:hypothetical protein
VVGCPFGDLAATQGGIGRLSLSRERLGCPYDGIGCLPSVPSGEGRLGCRVPEVPHAECPRPLIWTMDYRILGTLGGWSGGVAEGLAPKERRLPPPRVPTCPELDYRLQKSGRPVRVEWLEWWKGWLLRSGAFPLPGCPRPSFPAFSCQALARREWGGLSLKEASTPLLPSPPSLPPPPHHQPKSSDSQSKACPGRAVLLSTKTVARLPCCAKVRAAPLSGTALPVPEGEVCEPNQRRHKSTRAEAYLSRSALPLWSEGPRYCTVAYATV